MNSRKIFSWIAVLLIIALGIYAYWYFMLRATTPVPIQPTGPSNGSGFQPLNTNTIPSSTGGTILSPGGTTTAPVVSGSKVPALRMLSAAPVGGFSASSTSATSTLIRWVDRGRGNIYETTGDTTLVSTLSNTLVPKIFNAAWNRNLTNFVGSLYDGTSLVPSHVYAELSRPKSAGTSSIAMYELHGTSIKGEVIGYAASPDRSRVLVVINEDGAAVGYTTTFGGQNMVRIFSTPMTQIQVSWPSDSIIAVNTKPSASYSGFLYFVNPKTGSFAKILGPLRGLSSTVSHDGRYVLYSVTGTHGDVSTSIYSVGKSVSTDAVIKTIADKCTWGRTLMTRAYCGVPSPLSSGTYPDDWNLGTVSTSDKLWQVDAVTNELKLVSSLPDQTDRPIDVYRVDTDPKDHYLLFMNKTDLSFWSLDISQR